MNKEKEITFFIKNSLELEKTLLNLGAKLLYKKELNREIYQNKGNYFLRISKEKNNRDTKYYLTLKTEGEINSISKFKEKVEIEEEFTKKQINKIKKIILLIGFTKTNNYKKLRKAYLLWNCECDLDIMEDKEYLEIEYQEKKQAQKIIEKIKDYIKK